MAKTIDPSNPIKSRGRGPTLAKDINRKRVYQLIKQKRSASRVELAKQLHLNKNTVNVIIEEMLAADFVKEFGPQTTHTPGRKPILLGFNANVKLAIGAQVTSTMIHWAITDLYATPLSSFSVPLEASDPDYVIDTILRGIDQISKQYPLSNCTGICVGVPGLMEEGIGRVIRSSHLGWRDVALQSRLQDLLQDRLQGESQGRASIRLQADNSVKLASLGEMWHGSGQGLDSFVYCYFGNGVGCSIIIGGAIVRGQRNAAGELGHIVVDPEGPICGCGNTGCLEACVSLPSILQRLARTVSAPPRDLSMDWIMAELAAGDETIHIEMKQVGQSIGAALSYVANLLNPGVIICDGPLMQASDYIFPHIQDVLEQRCVSITVDQLLLVRSELFPYAGCIGAAASVIHAWEEELITFDSTT